MFKRKHLSLFLLLATLALVASSCVKDVILDAGDRTVVVECILCDVPQQELRLSFSKGASESSVEELTEAVVRLIDLTETRTVGEFKKEADGIWRLDYTAVPLHRYRLEVEVPGFDMIYAEDTMPDVVPFDRSDRTINADAWWTPRIVPQGDVLYHSGGTSFNYTDSGKGDKHIWVYGMGLNATTGQYELVDKICCTTNLDREGFIDDYNVTEEVYEALMIQTTFPYEYDGVRYPTFLTFYHQLNGIPFHKRFIRIEATGLLAFANIWCSFIEMKAVEKELTGLANSDHVFSDALSRFLSLHKNLSDIDGVILDRFEPSYSDGYLVFKSVSDNYNQYFEEALFQLRRQNKESTDMSEMSIYMRENIYSNVKGGAGIFATSTQKTEPLLIYPTVYFDLNNPQ